MNPFLNTNYNVSFKWPNYPCREKEQPDEPVCREISFEQLKKIREEEEARKIVKKFEPCPGNKDLKKRKFDGRKICWMPYSRPWDPDENLFGGHKLWPKGIKRRRKIRDLWKKKCPRKFDSYERKLWIPICEKKKNVEKICPEPFDPRLCVFCLGSLYAGGHILDLRNKIPLVKRQSQEKGDEIDWRIGIATKITVHKTCYNEYVARLCDKKKESPKFESDSSTEEDSDLCGEERKSEEEIPNEIPPIKPHFCLRKSIPPPFDPRESLKMDLESRKKIKK